uniref:mRNA n=1 Tax=Oulactis muscosa TaxID=1742620 RepID=A0A4D8XKS5_9CNID|nr:mRNA [Oulactis muscosa]
MSNKGLLCLVLIVALVATSVAHPKDVDIKSGKRALGCTCRGMSGDYWFYRVSCPSGYGYSTTCQSAFGMCCVK